MCTIRREHPVSLGQLGVALFRGIFPSRRGNKGSILSLIALFLTGLLSTSAPAKESNICQHVILRDGSLTLNGNERVLVCGSERGGEGWIEVPIPQAQLHLTAILRNLGYLNPRFERRANELDFWQGERTLIQSLHVDESSGLLQPKRVRKVLRQPLMPDRLNHVENWANQFSRSHGHACPVISVEAHAWDGSVNVDAKLGDKQRITALDPGDLDGLNPDVLYRYQPFELGDEYDIRKTGIMASRLLRTGIFQSAYFTNACEGTATKLKLETSVGKPRILRFGIGGSTEALPFVDLNFKNTRLDEKASSFTALAHASPRRFTLGAQAELYWFPGWHRTFLGPRADYTRKIEPSFETGTAKVGVDAGLNFDAWDTRFTAKLGPTLNNSRTFKGLGPAEVSFPTIDGSVALMSHVYEFGMRDQYSGWNASFIYRSQSKGLGSQIDVSRYELDLKHLWNMGAYWPPLFVLGSRFQTTVVDAPNLTSDVNDQIVPIDERVYAGGDDNLRGFGRKEISNGDVGYLTFAYLGFELRLIEELPWHLQPFLLADAGQLSPARYTLDPPVYVSQGIGLRWPSPLGTLRGSAATGRVWRGNATTDGIPQKWVYFLSFGQEF